MRAEGLNVSPYELPDAALLQTSEIAAQCMVWRPERTVVVIGKGSDPALEVDMAETETDAVSVLRRATGGCAVVLSPEMLVASFAILHDFQLPSKEYFHIFNSLIIHALARQGVARLEHRGISDIAIHGRKIAGTAIYRNRRMIFFHAIINVAGSTHLMEKYLKMPPRVPDYRDGRPHSAFVTSLAEHGHTLDETRFEHDLQEGFTAALPELMPAADGAKP